MRALHLLVIVLSAGILSACTGAYSDVTIPIELQGQLAEPSGEIRSEAITVIDLRRDSVMRRTVFNQSLGDIVLSPPETEIIRQQVESTLDRLSRPNSEMASWPNIYCGLKTFDIVTPATPLYWDVTTRIELILRVLGKESSVSAEVVERTWVYPSVEIIKRVTQEALQNIAAQIDTSLPALLEEAP